ncbi:MAG: hypothetical protein WBY44_14395 [Bryobacteraceae bacterium]|jgi:chaperonin cofactor prefoldin
MNDAQLYLAVGLPTIAVLVGVLINAMQFNAQFSTLNSRLSALENHVSNFESRVESRLSNLEAKMNDRLELIVGKLIELDNRLTRVEERLEHLR